MPEGGWMHPAAGRRVITILLGLLGLAGLLACLPLAAGHGVEEGDAGFIAGNEGLALGPFAYLGAKHMVTGYDHLLFLAGVLFFVFRLKDVVLYVSMFTLGHSLTLLVGVLARIEANAFLVDAVIGASVVYKGFDNLGGWTRVLGWQPDLRLSVLGFGLVHGFGLATKVQELAPSRHGIVGNILAFNVGVELGQALALTGLLLLLGFWRRHPRYAQHAFLANTLLMAAGFTLIAMQLTGYFLEA